MTKTTTQHKTAPAAEALTSFGNQDIPVSEKTGKVAGLFSQVSHYYDLMNDYLSWGLHHAWKQQLVSAMAIEPGTRVLDLACGTGDVAALIQQQHPDCRLVLADINPEMMQHAKKRLGDKVDYLLANAEALPIETASFDRVVIAMGIRNVTHVDKALSEIYRVLGKPAQAFIMELALPDQALLRFLAKAYLDHALPEIGACVANDRHSYAYLGQSIQRFYPPERLAAMLGETGFCYQNTESLSGGAVRIYKAYKL